MSGTGLVVVLSAMVLLVSFSTARFDTDLLLPSQGHGVEGVKDEKPWACCDMCLCTFSEPPQCRCTDVMVGGCHPNCKKCACTRSFPPKCRCLDVIVGDCGERCHP